MVLGHLLRGGSPSAFDRTAALRFGAAAVRALADGHSGVMVALAFPDVNLEIAPKRGNAVFFSYERPHPSTRTLHGGAPVIAGVRTFPLIAIAGFLVMFMQAGFAFLEIVEVHLIVVHAGMMRVTADGDAREPRRCGRPLQHAHEGKHGCLLTWPASGPASAPGSSGRRPSRLPPPHARWRPA